MPRRFFGTDGVRGPYGGPVVNESFAARLGEAAGRWIASQGGKGAVLIGRDTRASGPSLSAALASGLVAAGLIPEDLGVVPTPAVARTVRERGACLGVVITASHNPAGDNGIKFFRADGSKLTDRDEEAIESLLPVSPPPPTGLAVPSPGNLARYLDMASGLLPQGALKGWVIAVDASNGATFVSTPAVLEALGARVECMGGTPDGTNINDGVGSEHPERLAERVVACGARFGVAHDGDGDRAVFCDETGSVLDGDEVLAIVGKFALDKGRLAHQTLVATVQSNCGLDRVIEAAGGRLVRTSVGDRYVAEEMRRGGYTMGGESSGHFVFADVSTTGDGLIATLKVAEVMLATGRPLSELRRILVKAPRAYETLAVREKRPLEALGRLSEEMRVVEASLGREGRILVRYSGTEPKLRILVEAPSQEEADRSLEGLKRAALADLA